MAAAQSESTVGKLYQSVIDDVMTGVRDCFLDEGVDEQVLQELRMLWESKLIATKSIEQISPPNDAGASNGEQATSNNSPQSTQTIHQNSHLVIRDDPNAIVPIQITIQKPGDPSGQTTITLNVSAACIHSNKVQEILTLPTIQATLALPPEQASIQLQDRLNDALKCSPEFDRNFSESVNMKSGRNQASVITSQQHHAHSGDNFNIAQADGQAADGDSSDDDDEEEENDDDIDDDIEDKEDEIEEEPEEERQHEESLNSGDDVSDGGDSNDKLYDTDNVVVCQYSKITRTRNKWKFHFKDGMMNLNGKDYVFRRSKGDADW